MAGFRPLRQRNMGATWGNGIQVAQHLMMFVSLAILCLQIITAYPIISAWLMDKGMNIPFWLFAVVVVVGVLGVGAVLVWKYSIPSYFSAFNDQFYKHGSLLKEDIDNLKTDTKTIKEDTDNLKTDMKTIKEELGKLLNK